MRGVSGWLATGSMSLLLAMALLGCGGSTATTPRATAGDGAAGSASPSDGGGGGGGELTVDVPGSGGPGGGGATLPPGIDWPAGVPADIPPFPCNLKMVLSQTETERGIWVRIFCNGVSKDQFARYLAELRAGGYKIQGTVFYSGEGEKAEAERRAAAGDIDEVTAALGNRLLTIGVPKSADDTIAFDMDGLTQAEADAVTGGMP